MITYDDLQACRHAAEYKAELDERIRRMESQIERTTTTMQMAKCYGQSDVQDKMAERITTLLEWRDQEWDALIEWREMETKVRGALCDLPQPYKQTMTLRYVEGLSWRDVARAANYSIDHVFTLHRQALIFLDIRQVNSK